MVARSGDRRKSSEKFEGTDRRAGDRRKSERNSNSDEEKVQVAIRIPESTHNKIIQFMVKGNFSTKTDTIVEIVENFFKKYDNTQSSILKEIDNVFNVENKVFMPRDVYKQLLGKSDFDIENEINLGSKRDIVLLNEKLKGLKIKNYEFH